MKRRGRKCKLTPLLARQFCKIVATPCTLRSAAEACGVSEKTVFEWLSRGEKGEQPFSDFRKALTRARGIGKVKVQRSIWDCDDSRVKLELLARIYPDEFARTAERPLLGVEEKKQVSIAVVLNTGGKTLEELATFPVISADALPDTPAKPMDNEPMKNWYNPATRRVEPVEPVEPIDNGGHED